MTALRHLFLAACAAVSLTPRQALAWGSEGHEIIADIARAYLTPDAKAQVDALLAADTDTLTAPDMASLATWADAYAPPDTARRRAGTSPTSNSTIRT